MKLVSTSAQVNATLAAISALLAAAPFTAALFLFVVWLPSAAYFARRSQTVAALSVPAFAGLGLLLSPLQFNHASNPLVAVWFA